MINRRSITVLLFIMAAISMAAAKDITDMRGRKVAVPEAIRKIYAPSPYGAYILYSIAPDLMSGLILQPKEEDKKFLPANLRNLPVIGSLSGETQAANLEVLLKNKPDVLILWTGKDTPISDKMKNTMDSLNIPFVCVTVDSMEDYPAAFRFLGTLLNRSARTEQLARYCEKTLTEVDAAVKKAPAGGKPKVYYAEGTDGLSTECNDSIHVEILRLAGDVDVHRCHTSNHKGFEKVSMEKVMMYNPDVIVVQEKMFYDKIYQEPAWRQIKAVKNRNVHLIPKTPLNWFDRPPSFMRFLGLKWLAAQLYPKEYKLDIRKEAKSFYAAFLGVDLNNQDLQEVFSR